MRKRWALLAVVVVAAGVTWKVARPGHAGAGARPVQPHVAHGRCTYGPAPEPPTLYPFPTIPAVPEGWPLPSCDPPGPTNTGVPAGTTLTALDADHVPVGATWDGIALYVHQDGATIEGYDIPGAVVIQASDVTLRDDRVTVTEDRFPTADGAVILVDYNHPGASGIVEDTEASGSNGKACGVVIGFSDFLLLRDNFHSCGDIVHPNGYNLIQDSWLHDTPDATGDDHNDALQITGGGDQHSSVNVTILHNKLENQEGEVSAIGLGPDQGDIRNVLIYGNILNGGGYSLYGGGASHGHHTTNTRIIDNRWMRLPQPGAYFAKGGASGPVAADDPDTLQGNVWDDTGQPAFPDHRGS